MNRKKVTDGRNSLLVSRRKKRRGKKISSSEPEVF